MGLFVTELVNLTDKTIGFQEVFDDGRGTRGLRRHLPLKDLAPKKTRNLVHDGPGDYGSSMYSYLKYTDLQYNIRLLVDGEPAGVKMGAYYFIDCARLVFTYEKEHQLFFRKGMHDILFVKGVRQKSRSYVDLLFRLRGIGRLLKPLDKRPLTYLTVTSERGGKVVAEAEVPPATSSSSMKHDVDVMHLRPPPRIITFHRHRPAVKHHDDNDMFFLPPAGMLFPNPFSHPPAGMLFPNPFSLSTWGYDPFLVSRMASS